MTWLSEHMQTLAAGEPFTIRAALKNKKQTDLLANGSLRLRIVSARGGNVTLLPMQTDKHKDGEWFASGTLSEAGGYYVYLESNQHIEAIFTTLFVSDDLSKVSRTPR